MHSKGNHKHDKKVILRVGENIFTEKRLVFKLYKQLIQLNIQKKKKKKSKKRQKTLNRISSKEDIEMAKKHIKNAQHH